jgi:hypothetical protein
MLHRAFVNDHTRNTVVTPPAVSTALAGMDAKAIRRAAFITLRRAILQNFPPGPERDKRLEWLACAVSSRQEAMRALQLLGPWVRKRRVSAGAPKPLAA